MISRLQWAQSHVSSQYQIPWEWSLYCRRSTSRWPCTAGTQSTVKLIAYLIHLNPRNLALSFAAGNATIWKPSPTTPLCSIAVTSIVAGVLEKNGIPGAVASLITGGKDAGAAIVESRDVELGMEETWYPLQPSNITARY